MKKLAGPTESARRSTARNTAFRIRSYSIVCNRIPTDTNLVKQKLKLKLKPKQKRYTRYIRISRISPMPILLKNFNPMDCTIPMVRLNTLPSPRSGEPWHVSYPRFRSGVPLPPAYYFRWFVLLLNTLCSDLRK